MEDSLELTGKLTVCASGKIRGNIRYGSIECEEGAKLFGDIATDWDGGSSYEMSPSDRIRALAANLSTDELEQAVVDGSSA